MKLDCGMYDDDQPTEPRLGDWDFPERACDYRRRFNEMSRRRRRGGILAGKSDACVYFH